ncbi:MAG: RNA pseudouridine synthase [Bacteroidales bacterium]|jgi:23S rRNA pseudouridine1911/1915/1917 synthase|nr:RNA pseudouridine synthase [Bacteroidales bacterium]
MKKSSIDQDILYEDNHLIILNKHASDIVQGDKTGDEPLSEVLKQYLKIKYHKPGEVFLGVVHRLDRPVSGAVIFARTSKALSRLNVMLRDREIHKTYWAIVKNPPPKPSDHLYGFILRNEEKNKSFIHEKPFAGAQDAELIYHVIDSSQHYYLLEVDLLTGRHHQIRAQLASIGCPIKGDLKYGYPRSNPGGFIHLHARQLRLLHPVRKEQLTVTAPVPEDPLWTFFSARESAQNLLS